jgi:hypothetical protein
LKVVLVLHTAILPHPFLKLDRHVEPLEQREELSRLCVLKLHINARFSLHGLLSDKLLDVLRDLLKVRIIVRTPRAYPEKYFETPEGLVSEDGYLLAVDDDVSVVGVEFGDRAQS